MQGLQRKPRKNNTTFFVKNKNKKKIIIILVLFSFQPIPHFKIFIITREHKILKKLIHHFISY